MGYKLRDMFWSGMLGISMITGLAGATVLTHYLIRNVEVNKINNIPNVIQEIEDVEKQCSEYFSDNFLLKSESEDLGNKLYELYPYEELRDWQNDATYEGAELINEFQEIHQSLLYPGMHRIDVVDMNGNAFQLELEGFNLIESDLDERISDSLHDLREYIQTDEYREHVGPLSPKERAGRIVLSFLSD